jgi:hypothetical protein
MALSPNLILVMAGLSPEVGFNRLPALFNFAQLGQARVAMPSRLGMQRCTSLIGIAGSSPAMTRKSSRAIMGWRKHDAPQ